MTPELEKLKKQIMDDIRRSLSNEVQDIRFAIYFESTLECYAQAYLDQAIRKCFTPNITEKIKTPDRLLFVSGYNQRGDEFLENIERFKKGEL